MSRDYYRLSQLAQWNVFQVQNMILAHASRNKEVKNAPKKNQLNSFPDEIERLEL
jgi:hypothetical protein